MENIHENRFYLGVVSSASGRLVNDRSN